MERDPHRQSELYRVLVGEAREYAIFFLEPDGSIASWNAGAERLKGYTPGEALGRHFSIFYTPEDFAAGVPARALQTAATTGKFETEGWRVRKDGSRFWAQVLITAARDPSGKLIGFSKLTRDLTERRSTRQALQQSEERVSVILRSIGDALIATDERGLVERMNPVAEQLTGWSQAEAVGRPLDEVFRIINEETRSTVESPVTRVLREGVVVGLANHTLLIARDGTERPIGDSAAPIKDQAGRLGGVVLVFHDQTDARLAERALRESEERLRLLVESVEEYAIFMLDPEGHVTSWNGGAQRIKGYTPREIIGQHFSRFYPPEDQAEGKPARALAYARQHGKYEEEGWRVRKDGSRFWSSVVLTAVRDEEGLLRGFAKITRDLTLRQTEQRLRETTERLNAVLEGVADGVTLQDAGGRVLYANDRAAQMCGFADAPSLLSAPPDEFPRRFALLDETEREVPFTEVPGRKALASRQREEKLLRVRERLTGRSWWSLVRATPLLGPDGQPVAAVNVWHDVTAQRRREEMLRFLKDAGVVLSSSLDVETTLHQLAQLVVPELADWCSVQLLAEGELQTVAVAHVDPAKVAMAMELQKRYPPRRDPNQGVYHVLETGRSELYPEIPAEILRQGAVDEEHWRIIQALGLRSAIVAPLIARSKVLGAITFVAAESGRRYEEADVLLAEDLGRQAGLAADNARLYREAREAVSVRDDFLSIAGHELKTPLAALKLRLQGLELAARRGTFGHYEKLMEHLAKATAHGLRLESLVNDLLDVSRIAVGHLQVDPAPCDLTLLVREVAERFTDELSQASCTLSLHADGPVTGTWDRLRLDQVVTNLLSNAIKYGRGKRIEVRTEQVDGRARLVVRDRGIGVAPADQARIFGRFERAASQRNYGGIGLGLWIVRQIVEAHGGTVRLDSVPGQGATFIVELPRGTPPGTGERGAR